MKNMDSTLEAVSFKWAKYFWQNLGQFDSIFEFTGPISIDQRSKNRLTGLSI